MWIINHPSVICAFLAATLSECFTDSYVSGAVYYWTAGQRLNPSAVSPYVWRERSIYNEIVSEMTYTN